MKKILHFLLNILLTLFFIVAVLAGLFFYRQWKSGKLIDSKIPEAVTVESVSYDRYAYQHISTEAQETYDQIYNCIINFDDAVTLVTNDENVLNAAYEAMTADYGDLFWISGYQYNTYTSGDEVVRLEFLPKYTMSEDQKNVYQASVEQISNQWLSGISQSASDYEKAKYVFETLIENVDYDVNSQENQNILSVFLYNKTVCQGYADAAWYLLDKLGINSVVITGTANNENHAWNLVYLDGAYYYMDVTWGNSKYLNQNNDTTKRVNYAYMALTTEEISQSHTITSSFEVPECLSNADNYYVHEGLYYDWFGTDAIGNRIAQSFEAGDSEISLKFSSSDLYGRVINYFFDEKHITDYCKDIESIYYLKDDNANVLTIQW